MSNPVAAPDVTLFFGPMLLGVLLNTLLYGVSDFHDVSMLIDSFLAQIMLVQAYLYYARDRTWFRYLVLYLTVIETVDWVCDVGLIYEPLIIRYATPEALLVSPVMLRVDAVLTVLVSTPIQLFIGWRIQVVTNSYIFPVIICILAIISFGGGIATTTIVSLHPDFSSFPTFHPEVVTWLVSSAACDIILTASLVYSLWTRKTNMPSTDTYINKIIRLTVQTGLITAAGAFLDMLFFLVRPNTTFNFLIDFALSKLYTNALISTLNARPWREQVSEHEAPNALFEQTPVGRRSFSLVERRSAFSQTLQGREAYDPKSLSQKPVTLDIASTP
ncbi:hypothetical protein B0H19DRAFT_1257325 [Mycena capillaripes]|nr:hypothetical protein B0H19DRAFT_1257325 [Mycena capillaripes]